MKKNLIRTVISLCLSLLCLLTSVSAFAAGIKNDGQQMLTYVNQFRTGNEAWYWNSSNTGKVRPDCEPLRYDKDLEKIAQTRAKEISVKFSHTRPNGQPWHSLSVNGKTSCGENILYGNADVKTAFKLWKEDNEKYSGQGHRRNMLNPKFKAIGVGHYVGSNGADYWVQEFSY